MIKEWLALMLTRFFFYQAIMKTALFFVRAMIWTLFLATAFGDGFGPFHHQGLTQGAQGASRFCFDGMLAIRVV